MIRVTEIKLSLDQAINKDIEKENLINTIKRKYKIDKILELAIYKKAIDARHKSAINFVYTVDFSTKRENEVLALKDKHISLTPNTKYIDVKSGNSVLKNRPVIVGFGPSGIFAAYVLAKNGYRPIIIEQGVDVDQRDILYQNFIDTRKFEKKASIQFGEGGAGTYSDGKLTTSISDLRCRFVLETLVNYGADKEILYINKPHVGTDKLKEIIKLMRKEIISYGGEVKFDTEMTDFLIEKNRVTGIVVNNKEVIKTEILLLGIGHSSRSTFELIKSREFNISAKPFSVGLRIEHPQKLINQSQYGEFSNHPSLGAADYKFVFHDSSGRSAYTFCMCPGGYVVCGSSEEGGVVTNGMSESKRDYKNSNSALLVNVKLEDFESEDVLAGMYFQRNLEKLAFKSGGENYNAPVQLVGDFINNTESQSFFDVLPTYKPGTKFVNFNEILPKYITDTLKAGIIDFDKKLKGFAMNNAILTGFETRSSSPIRIVRDNNYESNIKGVYPMGEGSGYAGGIMTSAVDGIKVAEQIIKEYKPIL